MHAGEMRVIPAKLVRSHRLRVAAYARVSTDHERQLSQSPPKCRATPI